MPAVPILNATTTVPANRTMSEIMEVLRRHGAQSMTPEYDNHEPAGLSFTIPTEHGARSFRMPVNVGGVYQALFQGKPLRASYPLDREREEARRQERARNVAWRILKIWIEGQLAVVQSGLMSLDEAIGTRLELAPGWTLWDEMTERRLAMPALPAGAARAEVIALPPGRTS